MKRAVRVKQPGSAGMSTGELDGSLNAFAARAGKKYFGKAPASAITKPLSQFAGQLRNMALQHHGATFL